MTKIQPFGCDVSKASDEEKKEFLRLLNEYEKLNWVACGSWTGNYYYYFGIKNDGKTDAFCVEKFAKEEFTHLIPISEGITILKQALREEKREAEYEIHPIYLTHGKMATLNIPKGVTDVDILLLISKLENIVSNIIGNPKS